MGFSIEGGHTALPNRFIDEYMPRAPYLFSVIYIYAYRLCASGAGVSNAGLAKNLELLETDVIKAWRYWAAEGVVKLTEEPFGVAFCALEQATEENTADAMGQNADEEAKRILLPLERRPEYSPKEISLYMETSESVRKMFADAQKHLGRLLSQNDMSMIFSFYDWLRLPFDVIEALLAYCASNGNRSMRYIEKVAISWADIGISTPEQAAAHIRQRSRGFVEIMRAMGISGRAPLPPEEEYMLKWQKEYNLPMELIAEACTRAALQTGSPSFKYADSILKSWSEKGFKSMEDVKRSDEEFDAAKKAKRELKMEAADNHAPQTRKKNRFVNYTQRDWDFDEIMKQENEYISKSLKDGGMDINS